MKKILIIPDVHGRDFWIEPVKKVINNKDYFIVFLGDYLSCYPYEWEPGIDYNQIAIERFKEVLDFKKENPEKVVLLLGNHDLSYFNTDICESRTDHKNWDLLNGIYMDNLDLFDLAWETEINGKRYFFSHAGVRKGWLKCVSGEWFAWDDTDKLPPADMFNNAFHKAYEEGQYELRESFEYLILSADLTDVPKSVVEETYLHADSESYISWEEFYTSYLTDITKDTVFRYTKTKLSEAYKTEGTIARIASVMPKEIR